MIDYLHILDQYEQIFGQNPQYSTMREQIIQGVNIIDRKNIQGHFTCSPFVFNQTMDKILCIYHKSMDRRLQPGGHIDDMIDHPFVHGMRELEEETGTSIARLHDRHLNHQLCPIHIDVQHIPARPEKGEGEHYHYDIQFVCVADESTPIHDGDEGVIQTQRMPFDQLGERMQYLIGLFLERLK